MGNLSAETEVLAGNRPYELCPDGFFHACQEWCPDACEGWPVNDIQETTAKIRPQPGGYFDPFCHPCQDWCSDSCEGWPTG